MEYNFHNGLIRWQISQSIKIIFNIFALALTVSEIVMFEIFDLEKVGHSK